MGFLETIDFFLIYDLFFKICFEIFILGYYYLVDAIQMERDFLPYIKGNDIISMIRKKDT